MNIVKAESSVTTTPSAKTLVYNGAAQELVTAGSGVTGGTLQYSTSRNGTYSANIPTGTDATDYSVWYKVVGDANHNDTKPVEIKVTIAPLEITNENTTINLGDSLIYNGKEQTQTVKSVACNSLSATYTVSNNKGTNAGNYTLTVTGTGNFTGTATKDFTISKKSLTGTNQTLLVKKNLEKVMTYDLGKLLPEGVTGTTTYAVGTVTNENGVLSSAPTTENISANGKLTLLIASVDSADKTATVQIVFTNSNYDIATATLTVKTTDKTPVTLSGVTCDNRTYNGNAYAYTGTPVWKTAEDETATGNTTVTYYKADNPSTPVDAPTNAGSYRVVFTISSDEYVGTASYSFEITKAQITVAAKNKSVYIGETVPDLTNLVLGTDYTVTGLCGSDTLGGTVKMSYAQEPDNTKAGTYEIVIEGFTAPTGDNYTISFTNGMLTIGAKPSTGGGGIGGGIIGGGDHTSQFWPDAKKELEQALKQEPGKEPPVVTIHIKDHTTVPKDVLETIKGKNIEVVFDLRNGMSWKLNGNDITNLPSDLDLGVNTNTNNIPVDVINKVTGEKNSLQLSLNHNGDFGFTATLTVNLDPKNKGLYANLYYYNPKAAKGKELEFISAGKIDASGNTDLQFTHASDYVIVIDRTPADTKNPVEDSTITKEKWTVNSNIMNKLAKLGWKKAPLRYNGVR